VSTGEQEYRLLGRDQSQRVSGCLPCRWGGCQALGRGARRDGSGTIARLTWTRRKGNEGAKEIRDIPETSCKLNFLTKSGPKPFWCEEIELMYFFKSKSRNSNTMYSYNSSSTLFKEKLFVLDEITYLTAGSKETFKQAWKASAPYERGRVGRLLHDELRIAFLQYWNLSYCSTRNTLVIVFLELFQRNNISSDLVFGFIHGPVSP